MRLLRNIHLSFNQIHILLVPPLSSCIDIDSNDAFDILGEVIVKVYGRPTQVQADEGGNRTFEEIMSNDIVSPMGLNHTVFTVSPDLKEYVVVPNIATEVADLDLGFMNPYSSPPPLQIQPHLTLYSEQEELSQAPTI